jgi:hypothetical protein
LLNGRYEIKNMTTELNPYSIGNWTARSIGNDQRKTYVIAKSTFARPHALAESNRNSRRPGKALPAKREYTA